MTIPSYSAGKQLLLVASKQYLLADISVDDTETVVQLWSLISDPATNSTVLERVLEERGVAHYAFLQHPGSTLTGIVKGDIRVVVGKDSGDLEFGPLSGLNDISVEDPTDFSVTSGLSGSENDAVLPLIAGAVSASYLTQFLRAAKEQTPVATEEATEIAAVLPPPPPVGAPLAGAVPPPPPAGVSPVSGAVPPPPPVAPTLPVAGAVPPPPPAGAPLAGAVPPPPPPVGAPLAGAVPPPPPAPQPETQGEADYGSTILKSDLVNMRKKMQTGDGGDAASLASGIVEPKGKVLQFSTGASIPAEGVILVGRAPTINRVKASEECKLVAVPSVDKSISKTHLKLENIQGDVYVTDLESLNGVLHKPHNSLDSTRIPSGVPVQLTVGDRIDLGENIVIALEEVSG